jgi:large subunit ribosomal protein L7/L12
MFNPIDLSSATVAAGATGTADAAAEETEAAQEVFDIVLKGFKADAKLKVIKEVKAVLELGLKEAKELVESSAKGPVVLFKRIDKEDKQGVVEKLKELGADVDFE